MKPTKVEAIDFLEEILLAVRMDRACVEVADTEWCAESGKTYHRVVVDARYEAPGQVWIPDDED